MSNYPTCSATSEMTKILTFWEELPSLKHFHDHKVVRPIYAGKVYGKQVLDASKSGAIKWFISGKQRKVPVQVT
jgi:hypothetical protein